MALEFPKGLAELQAEEMPEITELTKHERMVSDRARAILAGSKKAYENLLGDEMLDPEFRERQLDALKNLQSEALRIIENLKDQFPDSRHQPDEYKKAA